MILVDSNILMYAAGAEHPHKAPCVALLDRIAAGEIDAAIDAEVLQEILHRYRAIRRWEEGSQLYRLVRSIFTIVLPITAAVVDEARDLLERHSHLMARDALHAAIARRETGGEIYSFDLDFDSVEGIVRRIPGG
ncbi:MAG: type II toxin-antitoxin system VapC family toxin [Acidobacteria bacterium]|nr:type II toxin-antitoxin system VapC family toxin [Acidobacteriota bacterium]